MVRLTAWNPMTIYRVMDGEGSAIGEIRQPVSIPVLGRGAETVLLVRNEMEFGRTLGNARRQRKD